MTGFHLRIAVANRSLHLLHDHRHLTQARHHHHHHRRLHIARSSRAPARLGLRRVVAVGPAAAPSLACLPQRSNYHRRRCSSSKLNLLQQRLEMASHQEIRRRSSAADRTAPYDNPLSPASTTTMAMSTTFSPTPDSALAHVKDDDISRQTHLESSEPVKQDTQSAMPPPPRPSSRPLGELPPARRFTHARAHSMATSVPRHANRLSLTLPIAPASKDEPIRPPSSAGPPATISSKPPTPAPTPVLPSLKDANDFIIAIAAQERKVLELREELARAEADLASLKTQWTSKESQQKRAAEIQSQSLASPQRCPTPDALMSPSRQSVDLDRKKLWLQSQQSSPSTPTQSRRKVMRGGHARTLSLLSPARTDAPFNFHEDKGGIDGTMAQPLHERMAPPGQSPALSKRATWQPRSQPPPAGGLQLVEDFRLGLRAFVEDIRQITVGDEPITGPATQRPAALPARTLSTSSRDRDATPTGHDRKSSTSRTKTTAEFNAVKQGPVLGSNADDVISMPEKTKASGKGKQFSWTPLGFETLEDNDWTSWESPSSIKSSRWSGSTIHNTGMDDIEAIPEKAEESTSTPLKSKRASQDNIKRHSKLDELLPSMVNRLSPSNLKRTANSLMDEWEKSLTAPEARDKENTV